MISEFPAPSPAALSLGRSTNRVQQGTGASIAPDNAPRYNTVPEKNAGGEAGTPFTSPLPHIVIHPTMFVCFFVAAAATFQPHTLKVKTCNTTQAGTVGELLLSFCDGESSCAMGPANVYNSKEELENAGTWNTLQVPLEYEPTTMSMTILGNDAW